MSQEKNDATVIRCAVEIANVATSLDALANQLDGWAKQSRSGGWSTHQVAANIEAANDTRRLASVVRGIAERLRPIVLEG